MEILQELWSGLLFVVDIALHVDVYLFPLVARYGVWIYLLLFAVIFCETGLVVAPFLPGDSLLFASGALAGAGQLSYPLLLPLIFTAAVLGDQVNYSVGRFLGHKVFERDYRFLKRRHLLAAQAFYGKHGGKAIILCRWVPIIRTFAPFVAGVAAMHRGRFIFFNFTGAAAWVFSLVSLGFFLGNLPFIRDNFSVAIYMIILVSIMPVVLEVSRGFLKSRKEKLRQN
ncbi:MAG: VTT domain-containing protein [Deltaproteobacteria bacterium]|jgi:membrane-associated protein|nr:VTT domain-containing protein [Deltaproteobacteria bacterium]